MTSRRGRPNSLLVGILLFSLVADFCLWLSIPGNLSQVPLLSLTDAKYLFFVLIVLGVQLSIASLNFLRSGAPRVLSIIVAVLFIPQVRWLQIYTDMGIFALGGADYWVDRAASSKEDEVATECLRIVLRSTRYGANTAENEVLDLPPEDRRRLFYMLVELAPSDHWRQRFQQRLREAEPYHSKQSR